MSATTTAISNRVDTEAQEAAARLDSKLEQLQQQAVEQCSSSKLEVLQQLQVAQEVKMLVKQGLVF